jgi:hypothetical protein
MLGVLSIGKLSEFSEGEILMTENLWRPRSYNTVEVFLLL